MDLVDLSKIPDFNGAYHEGVCAYTCIGEDKKDLVEVEHLHIIKNGHSRTHIFHHAVYNILKSTTVANRNSTAVRLQIGALAVCLQVGLICTLPDKVHVKYDGGTTKKSKTYFDENDDKRPAISSKRKILAQASKAPIPETKKKVVHSKKYNTKSNNKQVQEGEGLNECEADENLGVPDGDWFWGEELPNLELLYFNKKLINACMEMDWLILCATVIVATKVSWYKESHHTGANPDVLNEYVSKLMKIRFPNENSDTLKPVIQRIGQWASTRETLRKLGVPNVGHSIPVFTSTAGLIPLKDAKIRLSSNPAGTEMITLAYDLAYRMVRNSIYGIICPNVKDFINISSKMAEIKKIIAFYHVNGEYLCGDVEGYESRPVFNDKDYEHCLGRLGTFGAVILQGTTFMKSPLLRNNKYEKYPDFDADFYNNLTSSPFSYSNPNDFWISVASFYKQLVATGFGSGVNDKVVHSLKKLKKRNRLAQSPGGVIAPENSNISIVKKTNYKSPYMLKAVVYKRLSDGFGANIEPEVIRILEEAVKERCRLAQSES